MSRSNSDEFKSGTASMSLVFVSGIGAGAGAGVSEMAGGGVVTGVVTGSFVGVMGDGAGGVIGSNHPSRMGPKGIRGIESTESRMV